MNRRIMWVLKSLLAAYMVTVFLLGVLTLLFYKLELDEKMVSAGIVAIYVMATLIGGIFIGKMAQRRRFLWGISLGILYFLLLLLITLGIYHGINAGGMQLVTTCLLCMSGGMIGGMIS